MRILITGATGFVGGHLIERLRRDGENELFGLSRRAVWPDVRRHLAGQLTLHSVDLLRPFELERVLREIKPNQIYHLAGYANTGQSFLEPTKAWEGNGLATFQLYEAINRAGIRPRILFASSGLVYGNPASGGEHLCVETDELRPASPYASSKAAADLLSYQASCHPGLSVVRIRCFNQIGPGQSAGFACPDFARQIAAIEAGRQPPILETGDLSAQRDLTDVRDMVRAFVLLMEHGVKGEAYNAGSGTTHSIRTLLDRLLAQARCRVEVRERRDSSRSSDTPISRADVRKLHAATGWTPKYSFDQTLADVLDDWRRRTASQGSNDAA